MKILGAHLPISGGLYTLQHKMDILGCDTCALFLKNKLSLESTKKLTSDDIEAFKTNVKHPELLLPHGSYVMNLANPGTMEKTYGCFVDEIKRCNALGILLYNVHPGSDVTNIGAESLKTVAMHINRAHAEVNNVIILLETMAGQGKVIGNTFEELAEIIKYVENKDRVGITLDTCHVFAAGYDIRTSEGFEKVMVNFDNIIGLKYLRAVHLNDSIYNLASKKDRHQAIGKGAIGLEAFKYIMNSKYFENIPMVLETRDPDNFKNEIDLLKSLEE